MRNVVNCIILMLVSLLLYCVFVSSVSGGETRYVKTRKGNYTVYRDGRLVGYITKQPTGNFTKRQSYRPHRTQKQQWEKSWSVRRHESIKSSGMYWWQLTNPSTFYRTK